MRAALLPAWPGLSMHFGIRPWEIGMLTPLELTGYLDALEEMAREANAHG